MSAKDIGFETKAVCRSCNEKFNYEELEETASDAPVATCPECGGHSFRGEVSQ